MTLFIRKRTNTLKLINKILKNSLKYYRYLINLYYCKILSHKKIKPIQNINPPTFCFIIPIRDVNQGLSTSSKKMLLKSTYAGKKKYMIKDNIYYALRERLQFTERWAKNFLEYEKHREISDKASKELSRNNLFLSLLTKIYYLPTNTLRFLSKIGDYYKYRRCLKEIEILREELNNYKED